MSTDDKKKSYSVSANYMKKCFEIAEQKNRERFAWQATKNQEMLGLDASVANTLVSYLSTTRTSGIMFMIIWGAIDAAIIIGLLVNLEPLSKYWIVMGVVSIIGLFLVLYAFTEFFSAHCALKEVNMLREGNARAQEENRILAQNVCTPLVLPEDECEACDGEPLDLFAMDGENMVKIQIPAEWVAR